VRWKKRLAEIERLRRTVPRYRVPFPDLSVEQRTAPCSNNFAAVSGKRSLPEGAKMYPVGHSHKQGYQLITPETPLADMGGRKT
jgi:hypothetical protein